MIPNTSEDVSIRSPITMIVIAMIAAERETRGRKACKKKTKAMLDTLGPRLEAVAVPTDPAIREFWQAQRDAHEIISKHCAVCPKRERCSLGRKAAKAA